MTQRLPSLALAACLFPLACADASPAVGRIEFIDGPGRRPPDWPQRAGWAPRPPAPPPAAPPPVAAFTASGEVAIVDGATGAVTSASPATSAVGVRDIAFDWWSSRLVVFESNEDEQEGEIATYRLGGTPDEPSVLAREHSAWVDGIARIGASPLGILVFEDGYGPRWKVLWNDGTPSQGVAASRPRSLWTTVHSSGFMIHALTYGDPSLVSPLLERRRAAVHTGELLAPDLLPLDLPPLGDPPTARLVEAPALGDAVLVDVDAGLVVLRVVDGAGAAPRVPVAVGPPIHRIEHVVAQGGGRVLVALASSLARTPGTAGQAGLVAIRVAPNGASAGAAWLGLPGAVRVEGQFFSRDLAALGETRVLAATDAGVFAVDIGLGQDGPELYLDAGFDGHALRGPLDALALQAP